MGDDTITVVVAGKLTVPASADGEALIHVIGHESTGDAAITRVLNDLPDVLVLDTRIEDSDARSVCRRLREWAPATRVLSVCPVDDETAYTTVVAGAAGSVPADLGPAEVAAAAVATSRGESILQPRMATRLLDDIDSWAARSANPLFPPPSLTATEREVLGSLGKGQTPTMIAATHAVTTHLVNVHAGYAVAKLHRYVLGVERIASSGL